MHQKQKIKYETYIKNKSLKIWIPKQLLSAENAVKDVLNKLRKSGYHWINLKYINSGRYCMVYGNPKVAILFKRDVFRNFGNKFLDKAGVGDTVNCDALKTFIKEGIHSIYTVFPNGGIYSITLQDFLNSSIPWKNKEGLEVRSISIHKYKPFDEKNQSFSDSRGSGSVCQQEFYEV